jgi:4a-hydroxytetrahydrobiopterin dehydratase
MSSELDLALSRRAASEAVEDTGWRYLYYGLSLSVPVVSMTQGSQLAAAVVVAAGPDADGHLRVDLRPDRIELSLQDRAHRAVTGRDTRLARRLAEVVGGLGLRPAAATSQESSRPVQSLEIGIDALDIGAVRPFWKTVMAYVDEPGDDDPNGGLIDPAGQLPSIWFQPMDAPRPQRNRVHLDITVADDEADARLRSAIAAGGRLVNDSHARAFWVLADAEGNEVCVCTWCDRDQQD